MLPGIVGAFGLATIDGRIVGYAESTDEAMLVVDAEKLHRLESIYHRLLGEAEPQARSLDASRE